jgi:hypothetical protein
MLVLTRLGKIKKCINENNINLSEILWFAISVFFKKIFSVLVKDRIKRNRPSWYLRPFLG